MKYDVILEEYERCGMVEEDKQLEEFYYAKLEEWDIDTPDDLEQPLEFFNEVCEEWIEELDVDDLVNTYESIKETFDDPDRINVLFLKRFITEKFEKVVRQGKIVKKKICKPGFVLKDGRCVKGKFAEKRKRAKGAKRAARKKKAKGAIIDRKRKKSIKKGRHLTR
jgi:hypothetical protein